MGGLSSPDAIQLAFCVHTDGLSFGVINMTGFLNLEMFF